MTLSEVGAFVDRLAEKAAAEYMAAEEYEVAIWFKPSAGRVPGDVTVSADAPEGFELAHPGVFRNLERWQFKRRAVEILRRLPILPAE